MKQALLILPLAALLLGGCAQSFMKVGSVTDKDPYVMYGKYASRNIYYDFPVTDSLNELWSKETNGSFSYSSVSLYGEFLFASDLSGRVTAYNIMSGKKVGEVKSKGAVYSAPFIDRNILLFVTAQGEKNNSVLNFWDIVENKLIREVDVAGRVVTELAAKEGFIYLCSENGRVYQYNLKGELKWEVKTFAKIHSSPVIKDSLLLFGNDNGELTAMNLAKGDTIYRKKIGSSFQSGGVISDGLLYIGNDDGVLYCIESKSGKIEWEYNSGSKILMTPVCDSLYVYCGNLLGEIFALNKKDGKALWEKKPGKLFSSSPALTSNLLIVPDLDKKIYFIDKTSGEIKNTKEFEGRVKHTPVIYNKKILIIGSDNGAVNVYEFR